MDPAVLEQMSKFVIPCLAAGLLACVLIVGVIGRGPDGEVTPGSPFLALALGMGCLVGNAWANERIVPAASATDWLGVVGALGAGAGVFRGEGRRGRTGWVAAAGLALAVCAWLSVRTLADWKDAGLMKAAAPLGVVALGLVVTFGLVRSALALKGRGGWPVAAVGWVAAFAASQVVVIGCSVQNAGFMCAGIAAVFGVAGVCALLTRRVMVGPGLMGAAGVALTGLVFFGVAQGSCRPGPAALYVGLLTVAAWGPALAVKALGERGRGWAGVLACAAPALAAAAASVVISPPFDNGEYSSVPAVAAPVTVGAG